MHTRGAMDWDALAYALLGGLLGSVLGVRESYRIERERARREQRAAGRAVALELMTNASYLEAALNGAPIEYLFAASRYS